MKSLRVRLAVLGIAAIYLPVLALFGVTSVTQEQVTETRDGVEFTSATSNREFPWTTWTAVALGPAAAALAWWWAGRAVRPTEELIDRLERASETQRRLIEEASHELRTPLSVLATNAEVLLAHPEPTVEVYREGLERSRRAAERLRTTLDELLVDARGRARTLDRRPADLMAIVGGVVDDARVLAERTRVALALAGPATAVCRLDEPTVRRAVSNLVDNAIRHSPDGSTVEVAVEVTETDARVLVIDHGPGIPSEQQDRIFERFWRGRSDADGTGLGLPIAKQIALAHGGGLTVRSPGRAGDGCEFELRLRR